MKLNTDHIQTTHTGSLPRPDYVLNEAQMPSFRDNMPSWPGSDRALVPMHLRRCLTNKAAVEGPMHSVHLRTGATSGPSRSRTPPHRPEAVLNGLPESGTMAHYDYCSR